jgi:Tfp pilus assembly protein PilX
LPSSSAKNQGFVLPAIIILTLVLLVLSAAVLELGTVGLRTATFDQQSECATYAAEAGLTNAVEEYVREGSLPSPFAGKLQGNGSSYEVTVYENDTALPVKIVGQLEIPANTVYFHAVGHSQNGTNREAGALFRKGLGSFQVGSLANDLSASNSAFDAYDSSKESPGYTGPGFDPIAAEPNRAVMASNQATGTVFDLKDTTIAGAVFVGPGGTPAGQIAKSGATTIASESTLTNPIDVEDVTIPVLPDGDGTKTGGTPTDPVTTVKFGNLTVTPKSGGAVSFSNSCLGMTVQPNGDFTAYENPGGGFAGGSLSISGNINDIRAGGSPTQNSGSNKNGGQGFNVTAEDGVFAIHGSWHKFKIDSTGHIEADLGPSGLIGNQTTGSLQTAPGQAPDWLTYLLTGGGGSGVMVENPLELVPGTYDTVTVDAIATKLADEGTYVIKHLVVDNTGSLELPLDRKNVTLYVTDSLSIEGENALVNSTRKAPNLKVYYTGSAPINLAGGSKSFFTLVAEDSDINLVGAPGTPTDFFGALVGKSVTVDNAAFHYDVSTSGIGTGTDSTTLTLLSRHR